MARAYAALPDTARLLLSRLAAFRGSVAWEVIAEVFGGGGNVRRDLQTLQQRGLLQRARLFDHQKNDYQTNYDLHPIVRRYAYDRLADPTATHAQLAVYFEAAPKPQ